jgi:hypothetical protein
MVADKGVIGFPIRSPFKGRFGDEHTTARGLAWIYRPTDKSSLTVELQHLNCWII